MCSNIRFKCEQKLYPIYNSWCYEKLYGIMWTWSKKTECQTHLVKGYYWVKLTFLKLQFPRLKNSVSRSVFGELQLTQILKLLVATEKSDVWEQNCVWHFYFNFERNYGVSKSKSACMLLNNINFNKKETESKMENPTHSFKKEPCFPAHIRIAN